MAMEASHKSASQTQVNATPSRRALLRGKIHEIPRQRPLGAAGEMAFHDDCTQCGDCARACPEGIILRDKDGYPVVSFSQSACTFCAACTDACETEALSSDRAWPWRAKATSTCLSMNGVQCRACQDHCDPQAIRFRLQPGGNAMPLFDKDTCTGCGGCAAPCPVDAIDFFQIQSETEARPC